MGPRTRSEIVVRLTSFLRQWLGDPSNGCSVTLQFVVLRLLCDSIIKEKNIALVMRRTEEFEEFGTRGKTFFDEEYCICLTNFIFCPKQLNCSKWKQRKNNIRSQFNKIDKKNLSFLFSLIFDVVVKGDKGIYTHTHTHTHLYIYIHQENKIISML